MRSGKWLFIVVLAAAAAFAQQDQQDHAQSSDFAINKSFLESLNAINFRMEVVTIAHTPTVHDAAHDCELHIAASPVPADAIGDPQDLVIEPPSLCKFPPPDMHGKVAEAKLRKEIWPNRIEQVMFHAGKGTQCTVIGFPRIFTEHSGESDNPSNPSHVFEIHPATNIKCGANQLDFTTFVTSVEGLGAIKPATADRCIHERELWVRENGDWYEFQQRGGGTCGNFAVVETHRVQFVRNTPGGGHSAIARVTADGSNVGTLKIYTLPNTAIDAWLAPLATAAGAPEPKRSAKVQHKILHGIFTYDYFAIQRTVNNGAAKGAFKQIAFPLALIVMGEDDTAPWAEKDDQ